MECRSGPSFPAAITTITPAAAAPSTAFTRISTAGRSAGTDPSTLVTASFTNELALVNDVPALMRRLDLLLTGGTLSNEQHQVIREAVEKITSTVTTDWQMERVRLAIYLITAAPEYGILR